MNITLIGFPSVGKSAVGKKLAKRLGYKFIDVDTAIEKKLGRKYNDALIEELGKKKILEIEQDAVLALGKIDNCVISPGGSVIYLEKAMKFLKKISTVVFLDAPLVFFKKQSAELVDRGVIGIERGVDALYRERRPLCKKYADITIKISGPVNSKKVADEIKTRLFE